MMDRTFSAGYVFGSTILFAGLLGTFAVLYARSRTLSVDPITDRPLLF